MTPALPAPRLAQWWHWIVSAVRSDGATRAHLVPSALQPEAGSGVAGRPALSPDTKRLLLAVGIAHTRGNGGGYR